MTPEPKSERRVNYPHLLAIPTRWHDVDIYAHVNNVEFYSYFDTVINAYLIHAGGLDTEHGRVVAFAVETHCQFLAGHVSRDGRCGAARGETRHVKLPLRNRHFPAGRR